MRVALNRYLDDIAVEGFRDERDGSHIITSMAPT